MNDPFPAINPPERVSLTCPLGLRFLDVATGKIISEGLSVGAWPITNPDGREMAIGSVLTPSGVHSFQGLPRLRSFENKPSLNPWDPAPVTQEFQIEVLDRLGRFLPCTFRAAAPVQGLASLAEVGSPAWLEPEAIPLFSSAARPVPAGLGVLRAELRDQASEKPAAWAVVEATLPLPGRVKTVVGMTDAAGRLVLIFGYPEGQRRSFVGSPPSSGHGLARQQWTLGLSFFHSAIASPYEPPESFADFGMRLNQPAAQAWLVNSPTALIAEETITFGSESNLGLLELSVA